MVSLYFLIFLCASCNGAEFSETARNFSIELMYFTHLEHFVMSPFCVWSVMSSACLGAFGQSRIEINRAAILPRNKNTFIEKYINLTKTLFQSKTNGEGLSSRTFLIQDQDISIQPSYKAALNSQIGSLKFWNFDFKRKHEAADLANRGIQIYFPTIDSIIFHTDDFKDTSIILSNIINFKGTLSTPFNVSLTTKEVIYNENNVAIGQVNMMYQKGKLRYSNFESMNSHILELPYGDGKFCMLILFPNPGVKLIDAYKKLGNVLLRDIFLKLEKDLNERGSQEVEVKIPRFHMKVSYYLNKPLNDMGVFAAFEPDSNNFYGISQEDELYISSVEHKAEIIFAEAETVAFASTPGYFDENDTTYSKAKQPFVFLLAEKQTASIIFGGMYSKYQ